MRHIIESIEARLADQVPALKYIAQDWGQLSFYSDSPPVKYPSSLLDLTAGQASNAGRRIQEVILTLNVTLCDMSHNNSSRAKPDMRARELAIYDLMQEVYKALHGWKPTPDSGALIRSSFSRKTREDGLRVVVISFTLVWQDMTAAPDPGSVEIVVPPAGVIA